MYIQKIITYGAHKTQQRVLIDQLTNVYEHIQLYIDIGKII